MITYYTHSVAKAGGVDRLSGAFATLAPMVRDYLKQRVFGRPVVELEDKVILRRAPKWDIERGTFSPQPDLWMATVHWYQASCPCGSGGKFSGATAADRSGAGLSSTSRALSGRFVHPSVARRRVIPSDAPCSRPRPSPVHRTAFDLAPRGDSAAHDQSPRHVHDLGRRWWA